jgi:hypothetical protein
MVPTKTGCMLRINVIIIKNQISDCCHFIYTEFIYFHSFAFHFKDIFHFYYFTVGTDCVMCNILMDNGNVQIVFGVQMVEKFYFQ